VDLEATLEQFRETLADIGPEETIEAEFQNRGITQWPL
jgi:hypothetical protein